jgi:hypothetical protein
LDILKITGTITEKNGTILPHASIVIKGTASGTTANSKGVYTAIKARQLYINLSAYWA